jgi:3-methyl-2-oxobutanoate hydroxymethyltransferase
MNDDRCPSSQPVTLKKILRRVSEGERFACLTCYDATTARWLAQAGVPMLLVGDSAAQMVLGRDSTIHAPLDFMIQITAAVKRGAPGCVVMADMPFMSYQASDEQAVINAGRFMTEGLADLVKVEVDGRYGGLVALLARAGIPVVAHLGWRPQRARHAGVQTSVIAGKTAAEARELIELGELMEARGAVMLLVEQCTAETTERLVQRVNIPVIGCGAGPACDGQVVVTQDLLGMSDRMPSFVKPIASVGEQIADAGRQWVELVSRGDYADEHAYHMSAGEKHDLGGGVNLGRSSRVS